MGRPKNPGYSEGLEKGLETALFYLALAVELYPRVPTAATTRHVEGLSEPMQEEIRLCLVRFEERLRKDGRKRKGPEREVETHA